MKKIKDFSESEFLKLVFAFLTAAFLIAALCMPDRNQMLSGLWQIMSQPCKVSTSNFAVGGYAATFLNMGLVGLVCLALYVGLKAKADNVSTLAFILTVGFGAWGINPLNVIPSMLGVVLYSLVKKEPLKNLVNAMLFSTGLAPLISDLMIRYPHPEVVGFNLPGIGIALVVGIAIGFFLPAGLTNSPNVHKGFDLYSAAFPVGMTAFFLNATLYKTIGITLPAAPAVEALQIASPMICNLFCGILFGTCIVAAFLLGCKPKDYWRLLTDPELVKNFSSTYGNAVFLMNLGVFGLFIVGYYNLIGATFNGVTFGVIFCMLSTCNSGSHPANIWPIMLGYALASKLFQLLSPLTGGEFTQYLHAQSIVVGLCYANGLSPIADKYGWWYGMIASMMHFCMVTTVPELHGGMCLYNGGFTAALVCLLMLPGLERHFKPKLERRALRKAK